MKLTTRGFVFSVASVLYYCVAATICGKAQSVVPEHITHSYTPAERLVLENVSQFHKTFNTHQFEKNGDLVADNIHVNSNGVVFDGRDVFIRRIARFVEPFPDVQITDLVTLVDGNTAAVRYVITGTHKGDLQTPEGIIHATNRPIKVDGTEFFTFNNEGKLVDLVTIERGDQLMREIEGQN